MSCGGAHIKWGFKFKCAEFQNISSSADAINICAPPTMKNQNTNINTREVADTAQWKCFETLSLWRV